MNTKFIVNDYIIIWNLLFGASISETMHKLKQKIWETYKTEYTAISKDKKEILKDYKNFIPNDDTVYNIMMDNKDYERIRKQVEKYRVEIMQIWDKHKKETEYLLKNIIRQDLPNYTIFVVNKELNVLDYNPENNIIVGKEIDEKNPLSLLIEIHMEVMKNNLKHYKEEYECIKEAILELAILNEYKTRLTGKSCYQLGRHSLASIKKWLYPYWLMYLGIPQEEFITYMMRDKLTFEIDKYAYEKELKKMNLEEFIDFCIRNKRYIIREHKEEIIETL